MSLKGILVVTGVSGLHKFIAKNKNGIIIVESLIDKKRMAVSATQQAMKLEDIRIHTSSGEMEIKDVFMKMNEKTDEELKVDFNADSKVVKEFFKTIVPDADEEKLYPSHVKKIMQWYHLVKDIVAIEDEPKDEIGGEIKSMPEKEENKSKSANDFKKVQASGKKASVEKGRKKV